MRPSSDRVVPYLKTKEFSDDRARLASAAPGKAEDCRWAISLHWSEKFVAMGGFPAPEQSLALAMFVLGEISMDDMLVIVGA